MALATVDGDLVVTGLFYPNGGQAPIQRSALAQETYTAFSVDLTDLRIFDAFQTPLTTPASDDLGLTAGTFGTGVSYVTAGDAVGTTIQRKARFKYQVPFNYISAQLARFVFLAGAVTSAPDTSTIDLSVYKEGTNTLITGSDLVATSAQSIASTTFADIAFDLTVTSLSPGDWLDCLITIDATDAGGSACIPAIQNIEFQGGTKG